MVAQIAAIALLALIGADLSDADCEPFSLPGADLLSAPSAAPVDACAGGCVPDCFCCSLAVAPELGESRQALIVVPGDPAGDDWATEGHPSRLEHIPLALL